MRANGPQLPNPWDPAAPHLAPVGSSAPRPLHTQSPHPHQVPLGSHTLRSPPSLLPTHTGPPAPRRHQNPVPPTAALVPPQAPHSCPHLLPCRPTPQTRMPPTGCACSSARSRGSTSFSVRSSSTSSARAWGKAASADAPLPRDRGRCRACATEVGTQGCSGVTHLPPAAGGAITRPRELPDTGADSAAAAAGTQLLLPQLHPAQGAHREALG